MIGLPSIPANVPFTLYAGGQSDYAVSLARVLAQADLLEVHAPVRSSVLVDARSLITEGMEAWFARITAPLKLFELKLMAFEDGPLDSGTRFKDGARTVHMMLMRPREDYAPTFALKRGITALEDEIEGFGQTVLAVLYDALEFLPTCSWPGRIEGMQSWQWMGEDDEELYLEEYCLTGDEEAYQGLTREQALDKARELTGILTRKEFDAAIPRWAARPRRVISRAELYAAAMKPGALTPWARRVFWTVDLMHEAAWKAPIYRLTHDGPDGWGTDIALFLRWTPDDVCARVFDDIANEAYNSGENHEFLGDVEMELTPAALRDWKVATEGMCGLALAVEKLLEEIAEPL